MKLHLNESLFEQDDSSYGFMRKPVSKMTEEEYEKFQLEMSKQISHVDPSNVDEVIAFSNKYYFNGDGNDDAFNVYIQSSKMFRNTPENLSLLNSMFGDKDDPLERLEDTYSEDDDVVWYFNPDYAYASCSSEMVIENIKEDMRASGIAI